MRRRLPKRSYARNFVITMAVLALASVVRGQDSSTNQQGGDASGQAGNQTSQPNQDQSNTPPSDTAVDTSAELNPAFRVSKLGSAQWLEPDVHSPLHLGPIYVGSISGFFLAADNLQFNQTNNLASSTTDYVGIFRTDVNYDKLTSFGRFSVQYLPEIAIVNGGVETNFSNQSANFTISRALSPRWTVGVQDSFSYVNGHIIYGGSNLDVNSVSGTGVQNPFLQSSQRWLTDSASASFGYRWTSRDQISFTPSFSYQHSDLSTLPQDTKSFGGSINWSHMLSPTKSAGLYTQTSYTQFASNSTQVVENFPRTVYESFGGSFSDRLSQSLVLQASAGASTELGQNHPFWTASGTLTLRKDFQNSSVALDGVRGTTTGPFLTNGYTNRADASYSRQLGRRWQASGGVAYQQQSFSGGHLSGAYVTAQTSYHLSRSLNWFAAYARRWQNQSLSTLGIANAPGTSVSTGITWTAPPDTGGLILPVRY
jgi:hypothetical protein